MILEDGGDKVTPDLGYAFMKKWLLRKRSFTALFAYNDNSAIGPIRAMEDAGLRIPADVSVVGFDDIPAAVYSVPALTTVRQPRQKMGELAARTPLSTIEHRKSLYP